MLSTKNYDPLEYVQNIKRLGVDEQMAEYQARYTEHYVNKTLKETMVELRIDFAKDIAELKYSLLLWILTISVAGFSTTIGVTYFMLKVMLESTLHIKL